MRRGLAAAAALVIATNIFVLAGVAYNRSQAIERVELTSFELQKSYTSDDNSGISLTFNWISTSPEPVYVPLFTDEQIQAAGFGPPPSPPAEWQMPLPRAVFVAFEIGGDAWRKWQDRYDAVQQTHPPGGRTPAPKTHLLPVDLSRDAETLRQKYPDGSRYLILRATFNLSPEYRVPSPSTRRWQGFLSYALPSAVHVPLPFSEILRPLPSYEPGDKPLYTVTICFGRRYEPWIESVRKM